MKNLVFDSSSLISIVTNNLLELLVELKKRFNGEFLISEDVKKEIIDVPLKGKKYRLEALMIASLLEQGNLKYFKNVNIKTLTDKLLRLSNSVFKINNEYIKILDRAEIESLAIAVSISSDAYVVDERTMRLLVEDYTKLREILTRKLHARIAVDRSNLKEFLKLVGKINIIRSVDLATVGYELGLLDKYIIKGIPDPKKELLSGLLWGVKLRGCSISVKEIEEVMKIEGFK